MVKYLLIYTFLLSPIIGSAQILYTVNEKGDKWKKIHLEPSKESAVVDSTCFGWVFELDWTYAEDDQWAKVVVPKSIDQKVVGSVGFIRRFELLPIENMEPYVGNEFSFNWYVKNFDTSSHEIETLVDKVIERIDGNYYYGTISIPRIEVDSVAFQLNGISETIPNKLVKDIYDEGNRISVFRCSDHYFVQQMIGDGAETHWICWIFSEQRLLQRYISWGP